MTTEPLPPSLLSDDELSAQLEQIEREHPCYMTCPPEALDRHTRLIRERMQRPMTPSLAVGVPASLSWMNV